VNRHSADQALHALLREGRSRASVIGDDHTALWDALERATSGGKRFRPALLQAIHDGLGGSRPEAAARVGAAIELLHSAFIVHDDVIDGDDIRRGQVNVSGTFRQRALRSGVDDEGAHTYAVTAGILAGDLAIAASLRAVATCAAPPDVVSTLLDLFDEALHTTAAGELADVRLSLATSATLAESLQMAEHKTSAYSFVLPMRAGGVLAGASPDLCERLAEAGRHMGMAFQLLDDVIGVFGDPARTGKSATGDLRTHKQTPLLAHAQSTAQWESIAPFVGREVTSDELNHVRQLLTESGSREFVEGLAASQVDAARLAVAALGLDPEMFRLALPPMADLVPSGGEAT